MLKNPTILHSFIIPPRGEESKVLRASKENQRIVKNKGREGNCKGKGRKLQGKGKETSREREKGSGKG